MAHHKSAQKRIRRNARATLVNSNRLNRTRTFVKKVERALAAKDLEAAKAAFTMAEPELMRSANRGLIHQRMASRKVSRLSAAIKKLAAESTVSAE